MRVKASYIFAAVVLGLIILYFVVKPMTDGHEDKAKAEAKGKVAAAAAAKADPLVQAAVLNETLRPYQTLIRGRTQGRRSVAVRAETAGAVVRTPVLQGSFVRAGTILCQLDVDARKASLDQARAAMKMRQLSREASINLAAKGYRSETQVLQDQANLDAASAAVRQAEVLLEQINIRAPFSGVFDHRDAEIGSYLSPGQSCGTMIELDPLLIVGDIAENEIGNVHAGDRATAKLSTGEVLDGRVRYVSREADPATRTYRVEVEARNSGSRARSGLSAEVRVSAGAGPAHLVPASALVLDAKGQQGVRFVLTDDRVGFAPVQVLDEAADGVWVSGLHGTVRLITVGQSYVSEGQKVKVGVR